MFSYLGFGFHLYLRAGDDRLFLTRRLGASAWGLFEISGGDLLKIRQATDNGKLFPDVTSLRCLYVGRTRRSCIFNSGVFTSD